MAAGLGGTVSKGSVAGSMTDYKTVAAYQQVKEYYLRELLPDWAFACETSFQDWGQDLGGRQLIFCGKNEPEYSVIITFFGEKSSADYRYDIAVWWTEGGRPECSSWISSPAPQK